MKKLNKFFAVLVALAMMATLCVSMAFAAPRYSEGAVVDGTVADPATGVITKVLKAGKGTTLPEAGVTFYFDYTQDKTTAGLQTADATISQRSVTFAKDATAANSTSDTDIYVAMVNLYDKDTDAQTVNNTFPKVGRYVFTVKERQSTPADATPYDYTLSLAEYKLTIDVAQDSDGNRYVANIAVQQTKNDTTNSEDADIATDNQPKVNPGKDSDNSDEDDNTTGDEDIDPNDGSQFKFTNYLTQKTNVIPDGKDEPETGDNAGLYVQKTVVDKNGNALAATSNAKEQDFNFDVTVKIPEAAKKAGRTSYAAVVIDTAEEVPAGGSYTTKATYTFTDNVKQTVKLKDGWRLVFKDLDIGAVYSVSEQTDAGYTTTYASMADNESYTTAATDKNITVNKDYVGVKNQMIQDETPTGILISNLPYIALALVAIGGLVAYVVVRRRQSDEA